MNKKKPFQKIKLSLLFSVMIFAIMFLTLTLVVIIGILLSHMGIINDSHNESLPFLVFALASLILGTILSFFLSGIPLKPIRVFMNALEEVANGNFSVRVHLKGPYDVRQLANQFNHMAEELGSVEMLRTDFINNFSHEFKTPIVSIRGFAKLLKNEDVTEEERNEYLDIIVTESERLTELAANVLQLSKIEQQNILTDTKEFNVSEQIRLVIAMMYQKWQKKHVDILFESDEHMIVGNEELLKQAWINLLDNALKFSPEYGSVEVTIRKGTKRLQILISDQGEGMSEDTIAHIFDKFYQGDTSHTTAGNGLGLTITAQIIRLHGGTIRVAKSSSEGSTFEILL